MTRRLPAVRVMQDNQEISMGRIGLAGGAALRIVPSVVVASLCIAVAPASADEPVSDGLLHFANVRVVNQPREALPAPAPTAGMRAYKDLGAATTRAPSPEEMQTASATSNAAASKASAPMKSFAAGGGVGITLDESFLQYSMIVRQADGSLAEVCVTGPEQASRVLEERPVRNVSVVGENRNDR